MSISDLIRRGKGKAGPWEIVPAGPTGRIALMHYGTALMSWNPTPGADPDPNFWIGHGSVSDQNGVNTACKVLSLPYRYDRDAKGGGPRITELCQCDKYEFPHRADGMCASLDEIRSLAVA